MLIEFSDGCSYKQISNNQRRFNEQEDISGENDSKPKYREAKRLKMQKSSIRYMEDMAKSIIGIPEGKERE